MFIVVVCTSEWKNCDLFIKRMLKAMKMNDLGGRKAHARLLEDMRPHGAEMCCPSQGHHRLAILQQTYRLRIDTWNGPN